jgi:hypothetical protein
MDDMRTDEFEVLGWNTEHSLNYIITSLTKKVPHPKNEKKNEE